MSDSDIATTFGALIEQGSLQIGDGYRAKLEELGGHGPIFMRAGRLSDAGFDHDGAERFREALASRLTAKTALSGDTVITTKGNSVGRTGYVDDSCEGFVYSPHLSFWRSLDRQLLDPGFLRYWAKSRAFTVQLHALAHGTDMAPYLSLSDQRRLRISLPSIERQRTIARILGAMDDKIELNRQIVEALETLIRIFYTAREGHAATIGDVADLKRDGVSASDAVKSEAYVAMDDLRGGGLVADTYALPDGVASGKYAFAQGDLLIGKLRPYFRKAGIVDRPGVCSTEILVLRPRAGHLLSVLGAVGQPEFFDRLTAHSDGTRMPRARPQDVLEAPVVVPENDSTGAETLTIHVVSLAAAKVREIDTLSKLRDLLLPSLISGKLRVKDTEKVVEEAV